MESRTMCWRCLRSLRSSQQLHERSPQLIQRAGRRPLSTRTAQWQQATQTTSAKEKIQPQIPTTAPTVTSNVAIPSSSPTPSSSDTPSSSSTELPTSQMQSQVIQHLQRSPSSPIVSLARTLRRAAPASTETYPIYGRTFSLFRSCAAQAPYTIPPSQRTKILTGEGPPRTSSGEEIGIPEAPTPASASPSDSNPPPSSSHFWHSTIGLLPTFSTWSQVTYLHMYLLTVFLRTLPTAQLFRSHQQFLLEHFSQAAEDRMALLHSINARSIRNQYLKDLFLQWRGILAAYDEGLVRGDAWLGAAVWRNLFKGDADVDWEKVGLVVAYMRRAVSKLGRIQDEGGVKAINRLQGILADPNGPWSKEGLEQVVGKESQGLKETIEVWFDGRE